MDYASFGVLGATVFVEYSFANWFWMKGLAQKRSYMSL